MVAVAEEPCGQTGPCFDFSGLSDLSGVEGVGGVGGLLTQDAGKDAAADHGPVLEVPLDDGVNTSGDARPGTHTPVRGEGDGEVQGVATGTVTARLGRGQSWSVPFAASSAVVAVRAWLAAAMSRR